MARNIQQSLSDLGHDIASFRQSTAQFNHAAGNVAALFNSRAFKSAAKTVELQQKLDAAISLRNRAKDIIEAKDAMAAQPNRWKSTSDYLKERDELKAARERVASRKKDRVSAFTDWHNRQYGSIPNALRDRVGHFGGFNGRVAFEQDFTDAYNAEFDPKTYKYEQEVKTWGRDKADVLREERGKRERRENKYRYARLQASRRKDERERLYAKAPWMKSLVQSGIIDKKFIPKIAKGVDKLSTLKNTKVRRAAVAVSVVDGAIRYYNKYRKAHLDAKAEDQSIRDSAIFGGNAAYSKLGFGLGMNETDYIKSFQRLQAKFGPATMEVLKAYGESMKDAPGWVRQNLAGEWGLSADDANIAMFLGGEKEFTMAHAHNAAAVGKAKYLRDMRKKGWFGARFADIVEDSPIISPMFDLIKQSDGELKAIQDRANKVIDSQYEASLPPPIPSNTNIGGDNNVSSKFDTSVSITVYGNADPQEIASAVEGGVAKAISRRANLDNISLGVLS